MKHYIDNIIKSGLPLSNGANSDLYKDCICIDKQIENNNSKILSKLSISLEYIYSGEWKDHKNYIKDSLYDWSSNLYENMMW